MNTPELVRQGITIQGLVDFVEYDPWSGTMVWRAADPGHIPDRWTRFWWDKERAGRSALGVRRWSGDRKSQVKVVWCPGYAFSAGRVAVAVTDGAVPTSIVYRDGDTLNLRRDNLIARWSPEGGSRVGGVWVGALLAGGALKQFASDLARGMDERSEKDGGVGGDERAEVVARARTAVRGLRG